MKTELKIFKNTAAACISILLASNLQAQDSYVWDALQFSQTTAPGSARMQGMAGAQTALGGEASASANNPAGLGQLRKSYYTFSPAFTLANTKADYDNSGNLGGVKTRLTIPNFSLAFAYPKEDLNSDKWRGGTFVISYNRINDFNRNFNFANDNIKGSMITDDLIPNNNGTYDSKYYEEGTNGTISSLGSLAYNTFLINPIITKQNYNVDPSGYKQYSTLNNMQIDHTSQSGYVNTKGNMSQWDFAGGVNYNDKVLLGASLGIVTLNYSEDRFYSENIFAKNNTQTLTYFDYLQSRKASGTGVKATAGVQFLPVKFIRLGASITTPTFMNVNESFSALTMNSSVVSGTEVIVNYDNNGNPGYDNVPTQNSQTMPAGTNSYSLYLPGKASAGIALVSKLGILSADIDYVDYASTNFTNGGRNSKQALNNNKFITSNFNGAFNYRVGAEARLDENYRIRAGYGVYGNGVSSLQKSSDIQNITVGGGYRDDDMMVDISYTLLQSSLKDYQYSGSPAVDVKTKKSTVMVTVGLFF